jgi:hypothetical protein
MRAAMPVRVAPRIARLRATIEALPTPPLLVGSSMGAFVSGSGLAGCAGGSAAAAGYAQ